MERARLFHGFLQKRSSTCKGAHWNIFEPLAKENNALCNLKHPPAHVTGGGSAVGNPQVPPAGVSGGGIAARVPKYRQLVRLGEGLRYGTSSTASLNDWVRVCSRHPMKHPLSYDLRKWVPLF